MELKEITILPNKIQKKDKFQEILHVELFPSLSPRFPNFSIYPFLVLPSSIHQTRIHHSASQAVERETERKKK